MREVFLENFINVIVIGFLIMIGESAFFCFLFGREVEYELDGNRFHDFCNQLLLAVAHLAVIHAEVGYCILYIINRVYLIIYRNYKKLMLELESVSKSKKLTSIKSKNTVSKLPFNNFKTVKGL